MLSWLCTATTIIHVQYRGTVYSHLSYHNRSQSSGSSFLFHSSLCHCIQCLWRELQVDLGTQRRGLLSCLVCRVPVQVWILFKAAQPFSLLLSLCIALSFFAYMYSTVAALHGCCNYFAGSTLISAYNLLTNHTHGPPLPANTCIHVHMQEECMYMYTCHVQV